MRIELWVNLIDFIYFCSFQVFHKDHLYIEMEKEIMYEKRIQMGAKTLFLKGDACPHFSLYTFSNR